MQKLKALAVATLATFALSSGALAATLNVNLKNSLGIDVPDPNNATITVLDSIGSVIQQVVPTAPQVSISNLSTAESYIILAKYRAIITTNGIPVTVDTTSRKSLQFQADTETITKDFFLTNPAANNVLFRVMNVPATWTQAVVKIVPVENSRFQVDVPEITFTLTPANGSAEMTVPVMPTGRYAWSVSNESGSEVIDGGVAQIKTIRSNGTFSMNLNAVRIPQIQFTFQLQNIDRSSATFNGETIAVTVRDAQNAVVYTNTVPASGHEVSMTTPALSTGTFSITSTLTSGTDVRTSSRTTSLYGATKNVAVRFMKFEQIATDFIIRDSRNSVMLTQGTMTIKDMNDAVLETIPFTGANINKNLTYGNSYKLEFSAPNYTPRTVTMFPRANGVREISLSRIM